MIKENNPLALKEDIKPSKKKTPKWLRTLEAQSWQAELLISGLVIAGLLQLPALFIHWLESSMIDSTSMGFGFLFLAGMFVLTSIDLLIGIFALHFLFRSIWIALLGLNSVYPQGIDVDSTNSSGPVFWKKMKEKYPDLSAYNQDLDKECSLFFSQAIFGGICSIFFAVVILVFYQIFSLLESYFPILKTYVIYIGIGAYFVFSVVAFGVQYLTKKYPHHKKIQKYSARYNDMFMSLFSFYIFEKPIGYISSILISNNKNKYSTLVGFLVFAFMGFFSAYQVNDSSIYRNFRSSRYLTFNNQPYQLFDFNYDDLRQSDIRVFTPIIPSDIIDGSVLKLFIPSIEREKEQMDLEVLSFFEKVRSKREERDSIKQLNLLKYADFNQIFVNDIAFAKLEFQYYVHPNAGEKGVLTYIPTDRFKQGKNILEIRKQYFSEDSLQKIVAIPFYFEGRR